VWLDHNQEENNMAFANDTTIVAAYRTSADAQAAATDLQSAGISRSDIFLESPSATEGSSTAGYSSRGTQHEGGVVGWFKSLFNPDESTEHQGYQTALSAGTFLLSVDATESQLDTVEEILNRHNPVNVHSDDQSTYATNATATGSTAAGLAATPGVAGVGTANTATTDSIPVLEEDLQVGKRRVLRGGVRVFSRIVETPVEESIGLREEHVRVNRTAVNRPATEADFATGRNQAIEVEEYAEEPVVAKQARVVEEVQVGKEVNERTETVRDTLRHTEVDIEQVPGTEKAKTQTGGR
jgi:uncharacterized protein (TIGR02271 family)